MVAWVGIAPASPAYETGELLLLHPARHLANDPQIASGRVVQWRLVDCYPPDRYSKVATRLLDRLVLTARGLSVSW